MEQNSILTLWVSYGFNLDVFGSLYLRPALELGHKNEADSYYGGLNFSGLYGYNIGIDSFSVFLYGGAGFGYNLLFSSTESGDGELVGNGIFGAKILFYGFGAYAEYRKSFLDDTSGLSVGLTFAIGNNYSPAPAPYIPPKPPNINTPAPAPIPPKPPSINDNNRDRDYF
jgi:hypothetical protein